VACYEGKIDLNVVSTVPQPIIRSLLFVSLRWNMCRPIILAALKAEKMYLSISETNRTMTEVTNNIGGIWMLCKCTNIGNWAPRRKLVEVLGNGHSLLNSDLYISCAHCCYRKAAVLPRRFTSLDRTPSSSSLSNSASLCNILSYQWLSQIHRPR